MSPFQSIDYLSVGGVRSTQLGPLPCQHPPMVAPVLSLENERENSKVCLRASFLIKHAPIFMGKISDKIPEMIIFQGHLDFHLCFLALIAF